jgi:hypothetical protein
MRKKLPGHLFPVQGLLDGQVLIDFEKAPDKARDKVYSTPGGALISNIQGKAAFPMVIDHSACPP